MKFHPTKDYLLCKLRDIQEAKTKGGLFVVKDNQPPQQPQSVPTMVFGEVLEVGPDARDLEDGGELANGFEPGDIVAFHPGATQLIGDNVNAYLLVKATAVVAIVEDFSENVLVALS